MQTDRLTQPVKEGSPRFATATPDVLDLDCSSSANYMQEHRCGYLGNGALASQLCVLLGWICSMGAGEGEASSILGAPRTAACRMCMRSSDVEMQIQFDESDDPGRRYALPCT
jgi:hypothetical protein